MKFVSTCSDRPDAESAAAELADRIAQTGIGEIDLLLLFVTAAHRDSLADVHRRLDRDLSIQRCLGATAQGVLSTHREFESGPAIVAMAASMPGAATLPFNYEQIEWTGTDESPGALADQLDAAPDDVRGVIVTPDPFSTPMVKLLPRMDAAYPGVPIVGGMASGGRKPGENRLLLDGRVLDRGAVGVLLTGPIRMDTTVSQGCRPIGRPFVITGAKRNVINELGGKPALEAVTEMVGELDEAEREVLQRQPIMVGRVLNEYKDRFGRGDFLIRGVMGVDKEAGHIAIADAQIRVGQTIQFHVRDEQTAREDMSLLLEGQKLHGTFHDESETEDESANETRDAPAKTTVNTHGGGLLFSCNGRGSHLFGENGVETGIIGDALGEMPLAGFFAAGEIGPVGGSTFLHGQTASLGVIREDQTSPAATAATGASEVADAQASDSDDAIDSA